MHPTKLWVRGYAHLKLKGYPEKPWAPDARLWGKVEVDMRAATTGSPH